jgi:MYXO-CTERM domain-containing protein
MLRRPLNGTLGALGVGVLGLLAGGAVRPTPALAAPGADPALYNFFDPIDAPDAYGTEGYGLDDAGEVVGSFDDAMGFHGYIENAGGVVPIDAPDATRTDVYGIDPAGDTYVGAFRDAGDTTHGFVWGSSFTPIDAPGASTTWAYGINASGAVVGTFVDDSGGHGFAYSGGTFTTIDAPGAAYTSARAIDDDSDVAGTFDDDTGNHGFLYSGGTFTTIDVPGATGTRITGIDDLGDVVGDFDDASGVHGFVESGGSFTVVDVPGADTTQVRDIDDAGEIVGTFEAGGDKHGFRATHISIPYTVLALDVPGASQTYASGIDGSGDVVGTFHDGAGAHGFLYAQGVFTPLDPPGSTFAEAAAINDAGDIVGDFDDASGRHGFLYSGGNFTPIDAPGGSYTFAWGLNASGDIVGTFDDDAGTHGFLYSGGSFTSIDFPGARETYADGINDLGEVVGEADDTSGAHGFVYSGGSFTPIDVPGASYTDASGINRTGDIVGTFDDDAGTHGFLYRGGTFTPIDLGGGALTTAARINDSGQIVGVFDDANGRQHGFLATPIPEPASPAPFALAGLAGLAALRRCRRSVGSAASTRQARQSREGAPPRAARDIQRRRKGRGDNRMRRSHHRHTLCWAPGLAILGLLAGSVRAAADPTSVYEVDFDGAPHSIGAPPVEGTGPVPRLTPSGLSVSGDSTAAVVDATAEFPSPHVELTGADANSQATLRFALNDAETTFDHFLIEADVSVEELMPGSVFQIFVDSPTINRLAFAPSNAGTGPISVFNGNSGGSLTIGTYTVGTPVHVGIDFDVPAQRWSVLLDDQPSFVGTASATAAPSVRILLGGSGQAGARVAEVDNVRVTALPSWDLTPGDSDRGPATVTVDGATGLRWLDLDQANGLSYAEIVAATDPGGAFEGWRLATSAEVEGLSSESGIDPSNSFMPVGYAPVVALASLIGGTSGTDTGNCGSGCAFPFVAGYLDSTGNPNGSVVAILSWYDNSGLLNPSDPQAPVGRFSFGLDPSGGGRAKRGAWLVQVPEPGAGGGLVALLGVAALRRIRSG